MIDKISIHALKSIKDLDIECSNINLFVGTNSSGKSTVLQALLLEAQNSIDEMGLNGNLVSLGEFREVRNYYMNNEPIWIKLWGDNKEQPAWIRLEEDKENDSYKIKTSMQENDFIMHDLLSERNNDKRFMGVYSGSEFHYLSCHRIGVEDIYLKNLMNDNEFGIDGQYALAYLLKNESKIVDSEVRVTNDDLTGAFLDQVNYWLNYIIGEKLAITDLKKTNYLQVKYNNNPANMSQDSMYARPINVGSGVSYLISIIIICLASQKNDVIVIENPEIHLHPKAQSRLCEFLYFAGKANRQLFIETHSDHIFNGLRVGVANNTVDANKIKVNFLTLDNFETKCNPIIFGKYGKIKGTNDDMDLNDLFDQFEIDMEKMLGI